jgi:TetR/AcrR family transcriptional regulator, ethionamide resistance regulator
MSKETRRQLPNRAARRRDILQALAVATAALIDDKGESFAELGVEPLARRAGISRASFYLYFEDKGELVRGWHSEFDAQVTDAFARWFETTGPTKAVVRTALGQLATVHRESRTILRAIHEMSAHDPALRQDRAEAFVFKRAELRKHITRGQRGSWVDAELAADTTAAWLVSMVDRVMAQVIAGSVDTGSLIDTGADIVWRTLYASATDCRD